MSMNHPFDVDDSDEGDDDGDVEAKPVKAVGSPEPVWIGGVLVIQPDTNERAQAAEEAKGNMNMNLFVGQGKGKGRGI